VSIVMSRTLLPAADPGAIGAGRLRTENDHTPSAPATTTPAASTARTEAANLRLAELSIADFSFDGPRSSFVHVVEHPDIALDVLHGQHRAAR